MVPPALLHAVAKLIYHKSPNCTLKERTEVFILSSFLLSVDVEKDIPPYGNTYHGIEEGLPYLIDTFCRFDVNATFFFTSDVARRFPEAIEAVLSQGFEVGCHGLEHENFKKHNNAGECLIMATKELSEFGSISGFRAPYFKMREDIYPVLRDLGYTYSSSIKKGRISEHSGILEVPVRGHIHLSQGMSRVRMLGRRVIDTKRDPAAFYMHPWEFVKIRLPYPRKLFTIRCGGYARAALESILNRDVDSLCYRDYIKLRSLEIGFELKN